MWLMVRKEERGGRKYKGPIDSLVTEGGLRHVNSAVLSDVESDLPGFCSSSSY